MQLRSLLFQLLLPLVMCQVTLAFSASNGLTGSKIPQSLSSTAMRSASLDENDVRPKWIDLPRPPRAEDSIQKDYDGIEIGVGRVAMVGFVGLFIKEVVSGESFGQQFVDALMVASGNH